MLPLLGLFSALCVAGTPAAAATEHSAAVPRAESADRERKVFEFLTSTDWCDDGCRPNPSMPLPETCYTLRFLRRGVLREWAFSDYLEGDQSAPWNFSLDGASSGRVLFGGGSAIRFAREGDRLRFGGRVYHPCARPPQIVDSVGASRDALPIVSAPGLLTELCRHDWIKEDDFDLYAEPKTLHFDSTLECRMGFLDGVCAESGRFSIGEGKMTFEMSPPGCFGPRSLILFDAVTTRAAVAGDTLTFGTRRYVPIDSRGSMRRTRGLGGGDLVLDLEYDGPLKAGRPKRVALRFVNRRSKEAGLPILLADLEVTTHRMRSSDLSYVGREHRVVHRDYGDAEIPPGGSLTDSLTLLIPGHGDDMEMVFAWNCRDVRQRYRLTARSVVRVR